MPRQINVLFLSMLFSENRHSLFPDHAWEADSLALVSATLPDLPAASCRLDGRARNSYDNRGYQGARVHEALFKRGAARNKALSLPFNEALSLPLMEP